MLQFFYFHPTFHFSNRPKPNNVNSQFQFQIKTLSSTVRSKHPTFYFQIQTMLNNVRINNNILRFPHYTWYTTLLSQSSHYVWQFPFFLDCVNIHVINYYNYLNYNFVSNISINKVSSSVLYFNHWYIYNCEFLIKKLESGLSFCF